MLRQWLLVAFGGAVGSVCRYGLQQSMAMLHPSFPWGTTIANVAGAFAAGISWPLLARLPGEYRLLILSGFLGGFTTLSSFALETLVLFQSGRWLAAWSYWALAAIASIVAGGIGWHLSQRFLVLLRQN